MHAPMVRTWRALLDMWRSGNVFAPCASDALEVTPPPVFCPNEASKVVARRSSKKSGSRFSDATVANVLISDAGLPLGFKVGSKFPPVLEEFGEM